MFSKIFRICFQIFQNIFPFFQKYLPHLLVKNNGFYNVLKKYYKKNIILND